MEDITHLLGRIQQGDEEAKEGLLIVLYDKLHAMANQQMQRQRSSHTLQPTALVNEAWLRIQKLDSGGFVNRGHFLAYASKAMRSVLLDHARKHNADRRQPLGRQVEVEEIFSKYAERAVDLEGLDLALDELAAIDEPMARAVELRFFGGASMQEVARQLDMAPRTLDRRWLVTKRWLRAQLN